MVQWTGGTAPIGTTTYQYSLSNPSGATPTFNTTYNSPSAGTNTTTATFTPNTSITTGITIVATDSVGGTITSTSTSIATLAPVSAITGLAATSITLTGASLTWSGGTASGVTVTYQYVFSPTGPTTSGNNPTTVSGLSSGTNYSVTVNAQVSGTTVQSANTSFTTLSIPSGAIVGLVGSSSSVPSTDSYGNAVTSIGGMVYDSTKGWCFPITVPTSGNTPISYAYISCTIRSVFTISFWARYTSSTGGSLYDIMNYTTKNPPNSDTNCFYLTMQGNPGTIQYVMQNWSSPNGQPNTTNIYLPPQAWFNIIVTSDGSTMTTYVNGINNNTGSCNGSATANMNASSGYLFMGAYTTTNAYVSNSGMYNAVYAWNRVLTSTEIAQVYANTNANISPPTPTIPSGAIVKLVGTSSSVPSTDSYGNAVTSIGGMVYDSTRGWCFPITVPTSGNTPISYAYISCTIRSVFTISFWARYTSSTGGSLYDIMNYTTKNPPNSDTNCFYLTMQGSPGTIQYVVQNWSSPNGQPSTTNVYLPPQAWFNIIITSDGSTMTTYVNGINNNTGSCNGSATANMNASSGYLFMGAYTTTNAYVSNSGMYTSVYAWNRVLTATEIAQVYAFT